MKLLPFHCHRQLQNRLLSPLFHQSSPCQCLRPPCCLSLCFRAWELGRASSQSSRICHRLTFVATCSEFKEMQTFEFLAVLFFTTICILELFFCSLTKSFLPHAKDCVTCKLSQNTCFCCMKNILLLAPVCLRRQWKSAVGGQSVVALQCSLCLQRPNLGRCFLLQLAQMKASRTSESADSARSRVLYLFAHCISICCSPASMTALYVPSATAASSKAWLMLPDLRSLRFADVL